MLPSPSTGQVGFANGPAEPQTCKYSINTNQSLSHETFSYKVRTTLGKSIDQVKGWLVLWHFNPCQVI